MGAGVVVAEPPWRTRCGGVECGNAGSDGQGTDGQLVRWVFGVQPGDDLTCSGDSIGAYLPNPGTRLLTSASALPRNLQPGLLWGAWGWRNPVAAATLRGAGQGHVDMPWGCHCAGLQPALVTKAQWVPWSSYHGSDLKDRTWETRCRHKAGIWGPQGMVKADQALALRGLRPLPGWDECRTSCFGVIYRAAIYIASISAAIWGRCEEAKGEGLSLLQPWCPDAGCPAPLVVLVPAWLRVEPDLAQGLVLLQHSDHQPCRKKPPHIICSIGLPAFFGASFVGFCKR